jgi:O-antigen ligase
MRAQHTVKPKQELKPLGVDIEAAPFVALAVLASLGLAAAAWLRPRWLLLLLVVAATMLAFAALDVREIFHQQDESRTGLAVLAAAIAALHLAAATVAGLMSREARRPLA